MKWIKQRSCFNPISLQMGHCLLASTRVPIKHYAKHPVDTLRPMRFGLPLYSTDAGQSFFVPIRHRCPALEMPISLFELAQAKGRCDICHTIVITDHGVPIASLRIHALTPYEPKFGGQALVIRGEHASFACS